jgi:hypothetical protein
MVAIVISSFGDSTRRIGGGRSLLRPYTQTPCRLNVRSHQYPKSAQAAAVSESAQADFMARGHSERSVATSVAGYSSTSRRHITTTAAAAKTTA